MTTLGELLDELKETRGIIDSINADLNAAKDREKHLIQDVKEMLIASGTDMARGNGIKVMLRDVKYPQVKDWDQFYAFIHDNQAFHLLQRRVTSTAAKEWLENVGAIPGVEFHDSQEVLVSKA